MKSVYITRLNDGTESVDCYRSTRTVLEYGNYKIYEGFSCVRRGNFPTELSKYIEKCHVFVAVLGPDTWKQNHDESNWFIKELESAISYNTRIVFVNAGELTYSDELPEYITALDDPLYWSTPVEWVDFYTDHNRFPISAVELLKTLRWISPPEKDTEITPYQGEGKFAFVSYSHKDKDQVFPMIYRLMQEGYHIWFDEGIEPGTEWDRVIAEHVGGCDYFIACISTNYLKSSNCKDELNLARELEKTYCLIYIEDIELPLEMRMRLTRIQSIYKNKYLREDDFYQKLQQAENLDVCRD